MKYLKSYNKKEMLGYFTNGTTIYELHILETSFFGLIKKNKVIDYPITFNQSDEIFKEHWDKMILDKKSIKKDGLSFLEWIGLLLIFPFLLIIWIFHILFAD